MILGGKPEPVTLEVVFEVIEVSGVTGQLLTAR